MRTLKSASWFVATVLAPWGCSGDNKAEQTTAPEAGAAGVQMSSGGATGVAGRNAGGRIDSRPSSGGVTTTTAHGSSTATALGDAGGNAAESSANTDKSIHTGGKGPGGNGGALAGGASSIGRAGMGSGPGGAVSLTGGAGQSSLTGRGGTNAGGSAGNTKGGASSAIGGAAAGGPSLNNCPIFPADNPWNVDISGYPVHSNSANFINSIGSSGRLHADFGTVWNGAPIGIPYVLVRGTQPKVPIEFVLYPDESDPGPYPFPPNAPIEGGPNSDGDRHSLVIDTDNCILYELGGARPVNGGASWEAGCGAIWNLRTNATRPLGWTSVDAAGLPVFPGLVRYDEVVEKGEIRHAVRFTVETTQRAFVAPASHYASSNTNSDMPPMGLRLRLRSAFDCSGFSREAQVICAALKRYGMILADNGSDWYISGAPDSRWNDEALADIAGISGGDFDVVDTGTIRTSY